jgi:glycosyltransferase involved in cell wall biosynthesis
LLGEFFDVEGLAAQAIRVLRDPQQYRQLGLEGRALIEREYGLEKVVPQFVSLFEKVVTQNQKHNVSGV